MSGTNKSLPNLPDKPRCPQLDRRDNHGKRRFASREDAEQSLHHIWSIARPGRLPTYAYLCVCGYYHLASGAPATR